MAVSWSAYSTSVASMWPRRISDCTQLAIVCGMGNPRQSLYCVSMIDMSYLVALSLVVVLVLVVLLGVVVVILSLVMLYYLQSVHGGKKTCC